MLSKPEQAQIKHLLQTQSWQTIERVVQLSIEKINDQPCLTDNEWETIKNVCLREGQIQGIRNFIRSLYDEAGKA